jgi:hypothetical protein
MSSMLSNRICARRRFQSWACSMGSPVGRTTMPPSMVGAVSG